MLELNERENPTIKCNMKENDKKVDVSKYHYESGALQWEMPYVNGKRHGVTKWYYESGALECEMPHINGEKHGRWKWYDESGKLLSTTEYKNDKRVSE